MLLGADNLVLVGVTVATLVVSILVYLHNQRVPAKSPEIAPKPAPAPEPKVDTAAPPLEVAEPIETLKSESMEPNDKPAEDFSAAPTPVSMKAVQQRLGPADQHRDVAEPSATLTSEPMETDVRPTEDYSAVPIPVSMKAVVQRLDPADQHRYVSLVKADTEKQKHLPRSAPLSRRYCNNLSCSRERLIECSYITSCSAKVQKQAAGRISTPTAVSFQLYTRHRT